MASSFLKRKAQERAKKMDKEYGAAAIGGSASLKENSRKEEPAPKNEGNGAKKASDFLTRKAQERMAVIDKNYGSDAYGGSTYEVSKNALQPTQTVVEEEPRDATMWDILWNSAKRGYYNSRYGEELYDQMMGSDNKAQHYEDILAGDDYNFEADGWIGKGVSGAAELLGQQFRQWTNPLSLGMAGTAAAAAGLAGQAGPQVLIPEEVLTVPGAAIAGLQMGSTKANFEIEAGHAYKEMLDNGVSEETAKKIALGVGAGNAALEFVQLDELVKSFKVLDKVGADDAIKDIVKKEIARRGVDVAKETAQEVAQEAVTITGAQIGSKLDNGEWAYDAGEVAGRLGDTAVSSALSFGVMNVPGGTHNVVSQTRQQKDMQAAQQQKDQALDLYLQDDETIEALIQEGKEMGEGSASEQIAKEIETKRAKGEEVTRGDVERLVKSNESYIRRMEDPVEVAARETIAREMKIDRRETGGQTEPVSRRATLEQQVKRQTGYGTEGVKAFSALLERSEDGNVDALRSRFQSSYELGLTDAPKARVTFDNPIQEAAFDAGKRDYILGQSKAAPAVTAHVKAGLDTSGDTTNLPNNVKPAAMPKDVTAAQVKTADTVAKALGVRVRMVSGLKGNAQINGSEVLIDENFQRKVGGSDRSLVFYVAHEIAGHRTAQLAPKEWRAFQNAMIRAQNEGLPAGAPTVAESMTDRYHSQDVSISLEGAMEEVSADAILGLYENEDAFYQAVNRIANGKDAQAKSGARKFLAAIREVIRKIRETIGKLTGKEKAEAKQVLSEVEQLRDKFEAALKGAVDSVDKATKNTAQEGGEVKHSISRTYKSEVQEWYEDGMPDNERFVLGSTGSVLRGLGAIESDIFINGDKIKTILNEHPEITISEIKQITEILDDPVLILKSKGAGKRRSNSRMVVFGAVNARNGQPVMTVLDLRPVENGFMLQDMQKVNSAYTKDNPGGFITTSDIMYADKKRTIPLLRRVGLTITSRGLLRNGFTGSITYSGNHVKMDGVPFAAVVGGTDGTFAEAATGENVKYSLREKEPPKNTGIAYKVFYARDGQLYPPMVPNPGGAGTPVGVWLDADIGAQAPPSKTGRPQVQGGGKGTNAGKISLAFRPGWHLGDIPHATQFARKNPETGKKELFPADFVWAECEYAADVDYQDEAMSYGYTENGKFRHSYAGLPRLPEDGYYRYRTNPNPDTVPWIITGAMKVKRILTDAETDAICREAGVEPMKRQGGTLNLDKLGIKAGETVQTEKYSLKDSEGTTLTKEQQEYFKDSSLKRDSDGNQLTEQQAEYFRDSKVRDSQGRLLLVYHGTPHGGFTVFRTDEGAFFSRDKDYARLYTRGNDYDDSGADIYEGYLNITKPFDTRKAKERRIFMNEFYMKWGNGTPLSDAGLPDWTDGNDLIEFIQENGYDYDGIIISESNGGQYAEESYMALSPEQFKRKDNLNPTSDPDIRFSLKLPIEEGEKLIAVHNVFPDKLRGALELGGFPMPSIAITKANMDHDKFGPISVLFRKETISPSDRRNKVYGGDAWTPMRPQVGYKVNEKVRANIEKRVENLLGGRGLMRTYRLMLDDTNVDDNMNRFDGDFKRSYSRNEALKIAFLKDKGLPFRLVMKEHKYNGDLSNDALRKIVQEIGATKIIEAQRGSSGAVMEFEPVVREFYNEQMRETFAGTRFLDKMVVEEVPWAKVDTILRDAISFFKGGEEKVIDDGATREKLDKRFTKKLTAEYEAWLDELSNGIVEKRGIRNDKDWFTPSGNRRSFEQLYMDYNLQNIVKAMAGESQKGAGVLGTGNIFGASTKEYSSVAEIREDKGRLVVQDDETHEAQTHAFSDRLREITGRMIKDGERNAFGATLDAGDAAVEALLKGKTVNGILKELKTWRRFNATKEIAQDIYDLAKDISEAPTAYFEAKPKRAVGFDEVAAVVVPKNADADLKEQLTQQGMNIIEYNPKKDGDRLQKINSVDNIRWSLKANEDILKENAKLKEVNQDLRGQLKRTEFAKVDRKQLDKFAKKLLRDYESGADINETRKKLDDLYTYIANGEDGLSPAWNEVQKRAYETAVSILEDSSSYDDSLYQAYKGLRDRLRNNGMTIDPQYDHDLMGYESINEFRKRNMGRIKIVKDGTPVDMVYSELANTYPEFFDEQEYSTQPDQLSHIEEVLDSLRPVEINPYTTDMRGHATWLANDIIERFFALPQAKPTFADKAEQRLTKQVIKDARKLEQVKEKDAQRLASLREQNARKLERERQKRREQNEKILAETREKIAALRVKEREKRENQVAAVKERYKAKEAKGRETRKARELRERILKHASDLSEKLVRPSDKHHIPEHLKGTVAAMLDAINLESNYTYDPFSESYKKNDDGLPTRRTRAFEDVRRAYAKILEDESTDMVLDPSMEKLFEEVAVMRDTRIADMTSAQLQSIWELLRAVEHSIYTAGKVLSNSKYKETTVWAYDFQDETATRKSKTGKKIESMRLDLENPYTFFAHYGKAGKAVYRMLRDAQDKQQDMVMEVRDAVREIVFPKTVKELESQTHDFVTAGGKNLTLTTAHIMEIYELMKRQQANDHLLKGGIVQPEVKVKGKKIERGTDAILLNPGDIVKITKVLTKEQRAIADGLQKLTTTLLADYGNEASMAAYGYKKFTGKDYWPIKSASEGIHSNVEKGGSNTRSIKNIGLAKSVMPHASNPLDIGGLFKTFSNHAADMTDYAAWLLTMEDANRLFNFKFRDEFGNRTGQTMKGLLDRYGGKGAQKYWHNLMEDIQNGINASSDSFFIPGINKVIGNVRAASVGANVRVIIQQPTAILRAAAVLNPADMAKGMTGGVLKGDGWKKALEHSAIAKRKDMGGFDISSPAQMGEILYDNGTKLQKFNEAMMVGASKADAVTWGAIWNACEWAVKRKKPSLQGQAFTVAVSEQFAEVIDQSQVVDGVLQRSQTMRSGNALVKQATAFMGEPTMALNMMLRAYDAYASETDPASRTKARKALGRTAEVLLVTNLVNALAQSVVDGLRDDDDEKDYVERVMAAFTGDWEDGWIAVLSGNAVSSLNPMGYVPFAKDIQSILQGYNVTRADADVMADIISAVQDFTKSLSGEGKKTLPYATKNLAQQVGKMFGVSAPNLLRDVWGLVRTIAIETGSVELQYEMEKAILKISNEDNTGGFVDILFRAYEQGGEAYERIYNDMVDNGVSEEKIAKAMESRMKKAQGVKEVEDLEQRYLSPAKQKQYDKKLGAMQGSGVWRQAGESQKDEAESRLYDLVEQNSAGEELLKDISDGAAYGLNETDYLLYKLALDMVDQPNKSGELGGTPTNEEKAAAIASVGGLSNSEIAFLWDTDSGYEAYAAGVDMAAYVDYLGEGGSVSTDKLIAAQEAGIGTDTYIDFMEMLKEVDQPTESGNYGSFTQDEATAAIRAMDGLTREERAYLWQSVNKSWKADKNPWR